LRSDSLQFHWKKQIRSRRQDYFRPSNLASLGKTGQVAFPRIEETRKRFGLVLS